MSSLQSFSIKHWAEDDRPREKLIQKGKDILSDAELLAILLGSGSKNESAVELSKRLLADHEKRLNNLGRLSVKQLMKYKGIGEAKAVTIAAAMELGRRRRCEEARELTKISSGKSVYHLMHPFLGDLPHEEFWVLYLSNSNKVIFKNQLSKGGLTATVVDVRLVFKLAFEHNAVSIILVHNHPSGVLDPSPEDVRLTKRLKDVGAQLDIRLLDHIIISEKGYYSFLDAGVL